MITKNLITSLILIVALTVTAYGQDNNEKTLKEAYASKFLIGTANDMRGLTDAELASVKEQYDINTPENCMKPQPIHPSEGRYSYETPDAMVEWCKQNGVKVWGHTLVWHSQSPAWFFQAENPEVEEDEPSDGAGRAWLYIEPDGDVLPDQGINKVVGNVLQDTFEDIWPVSV